MNKEKDFSIKLEDLAPVNNVDVDVYIEALDFSMSNDKIKNIALSGAYGSGKSSIIETYKSKNTKKNFLNVSLASFDDYESSDIKEKIDISLLERKIVNQLAHQIKTYKVPHSIFKVKEKYNSGFFIFTILFILSIICLVLTITNFNWFISVWNTTRYIMLLIIMPVLFISIYTYRYLFGNSLLKKIEYNGKAIEFNDTEYSFFDKYLDEILYLFKQCDADAVVFDDLDRFNNYKIFERLREINTLINKGGKKSIKFFYLIKDDILKPEDRTKFFDLIIPVIPVVDQTNSCEILTKYNKNNNLGLTQDFLKSVSMYLKEMRILKNVVNEFQIYNAILNKDEDIAFNKDKLFAIILYKNFFPRDFIDLQNGSGSVWKIINSRDSLVCNHIETLKNKREKLNSSSEENRINDIDLQIKTAYSLHLRDLLNKTEIDKILDNGKIKSSDNYNLLIYLLCNGYIDESYPTYIAYFYQELITNNDRSFLTSIHGKTALVYGYKLDNPRIIYESLGDNEFNKVEILNFDLLDYLTFNNKTNQLLHIIDTIHNNEKFDFLCDYINKCISSSSENTNHIEDFIRLLCNKYWSNFSQQLISFSIEKEYDILAFIQLVIDCLDSDVLIEQNIDGCLTNYISNNSLFLNPRISVGSNFINNLSIINVKFNHLDINSNDSLLKDVYDNSLYSINFDNISMIMKKYLNIKNNKDIAHKNFTIVFNNKDSSIYNYLNKNIDSYLDCIMNKCDRFICDNTDAAIYLINNDELAKENKEKYISLLKTPITDFSVINNKTLWHCFLHANNIKNKENAFIQYFKEYKLDNYLTEFANNNKNLDYSFLNDIFTSDSDRTTLLNAIATNNNLSNNVYKNMLSSFKQYYTVFNLANISDEKINILIELNKIKMSPDNLKFIRSTYPKNITNFLSSSVESYRDIVVSNPTLFSFNETISISKKIKNKDIVLELLSFNKQPVSIINANYDNYIKEYLITNNKIILEDLKEYINLYNEQDDSIKTALFNNIINNQSIMSHDSFNLPYDLQTKLYESSTIQNANKKTMFLRYIDIYDKKQIKRIINNYLDEYSNLLDTSKESIIRNDSYNLKLVKCLKDKNLINNYTNNGSNIKINSKIG